MGESPEEQARRLVREWTDGYVLDHHESLVEGIASALAAAYRRGLADGKEQEREEEAASVPALRVVRQREEEAARWRAIMNAERALTPEQVAALAPPAPGRGEGMGDETMPAPDVAAALARLRCKVTGHPAGTDTVMAGRVCPGPGEPCDPCVLRAALARHARLVAAARGVLAAFDAGVFVRSIDHDHESGWALRLVAPLRDLATLQELAALDAPEGV